MDAKKLLVGVATFSIGWMLGLYLGKMVMGGASMKSASMPVTDAGETDESSEESFGYGNYDY